MDGRDALPGPIASQCAVAAHLTAEANGYHESFDGKLRDELLQRELFYSLAEAKYLVETCRQHFNQVRPHSSLGYRPPAPLASLSLAIVQLSLKSWTTKRRQVTVRRRFCGWQPGTPPNISGRAIWARLRPESWPI